MSLLGRAKINQQRKTRTVEESRGTWKERRAERATETGLRKPGEKAPETGRERQLWQLRLGERWKQGWIAVRKAGAGVDAKGGGKKVLNEATMEAVVDPANMRVAYLALKASGGAPGVGRVGGGIDEEHLQEHGEAIAKKLLEGRYQPAAVRAVDNSKANGGKRLLGIPTG